MCDFTSVYPIHLSCFSCETVPCLWSLLPFTEPLQFSWILRTECRWSHYTVVQWHTLFSALFFFLEIPSIQVLFFWPLSIALTFSSNCPHSWASMVSTEPFSYQVKPVFFLLDALLIRFHLLFYWPVVKLEFLDSCWVNTAQCWPLVGSFCPAVPSLDTSYGHFGLTRVPCKKYFWHRSLPSSST